MKFILKNNLSLFSYFLFFIGFGLSNNAFSQKNQAEDVFVPYRKDDKWGIVTADKKMVIKPVYNEPFSFQRDSSVFDGKILHYASVNINGKYGAINEKNELFIPAEHKTPIYLHQGFFSFGVNFDNQDKNVEKFALYNYKNKKIFSSKFPIGIIRDFQDGLKAISLITNPKSYVGVLGFIDYEGKTVIPFMYEGNNPMSDYHFEKGYALVPKKGKMGVINKQNKVIYPFVLDGIPGENTTDENGNIKLNIFDGTEILIDTKGNVLSKKNINDKDNNQEIKIPNSSNLIKHVKKDINQPYVFSYMLIDKNKKRLSKNEYDNISEFKNGVAITQKTNPETATSKYGIIDENDTQIIPLATNYIYDWGENHYIIKDSIERFGVFNTKTKKIEIECKYTGCNSYMLKSGVIMMEKEQNNVKQYIIVNQKGEELREITGYDIIENGYNNYINMKNYFRVKKGNKYSILDENFNEILPFYEEIKNISINSKTEIKAKKNGLWGIVNLKNEVLVPFEYDNIEDYTMNPKNIIETKKNNKILYIKIPENVGEKVVEYAD